MIHREEDIVAWGIARNLIGPTGEATPIGQMTKTYEECVEVMDAINKNDGNALIDGIGDVVVTLVLQTRLQGLKMQDCYKLVPPIPEVDSAKLLVFALMASANQMHAEIAINGAIAQPLGMTFRACQALARYHSLSLEGCIDAAWNEIKDRKGRMQGGVFVKEA